MSEIKQEILEKLASDFYPNENELMERIAFKRGHTEAEEKMYSEEEVIKIIKECKSYLSFGDEFNEIEWFKQFKK